MKRTIVALAIFLSLSAHSAPAAEAFFDREYERFNREESFKVLDQLDSDIQVRIDESKGEKTAEESAEEELEKAEVKPGSEQAGGMRLSVRPRGEVKLIRESNVFQRRNDALGESTAVYVPGVKASTRFFESWKYTSDYQMSYYQNKNFHFNDRADHEWAQILSRRGSKLMVSMENTLSFFKFRSETREEELSPIKMNALSTNVAYRVLPRLTLTGYYANSYVEFKNTPQKSSNILDNAFGMEIAYQWSPRLDIFTNYSYRFVRPPKLDELSDINVQNVLVGVRGILTPKLVVNAGLGLDSHEFAGTDDIVGAVAQGAVRYLYSPKLDFAFRYQRDTVPTGTESSADPLNQVLDFETTFRWSPKITLKAGQTVRFLQSGTESTVLDPENPHISTTKKDETVRLGSRLGAEIRPSRSLIIDAEYGFERVVDELQTGDYTNHVASIEVSKQF